MIFPTRSSESLQKKVVPSQHELRNMPKGLNIKLVIMNQTLNFQQVLRADPLIRRNPGGGGIELFSKVKDIQ